MWKTLNNLLNYDLGHDEKTAKNRLTNRKGEGGTREKEKQKDG